MNPIQVLHLKADSLWEQKLSPQQSSYAEFDKEIMERKCISALPEANEAEKSGIEKLQFLPETHTTKQVMKFKAMRVPK